MLENNANQKNGDQLPITVTKKDLTRMYEISYFIMRSWLKDFKWYNRHKKTRYFTPSQTSDIFKSWGQPLNS